MKSVMALGLLAASFPALAANWMVEPAKSSISFAATHAGKAVNGSFGKWTSSIQFDPAQLKTAKVVVQVDLASARTGDKLYDGTLPQSDWFDTAKQRMARFETSSITANGKDYVAHGTLTIRGITVPVTLPFTLAITGNQAVMRGRTTLKRMAFGIGKSSDATGEWVSLDIPLTLSVTARKQ